MGTTLGLCQTQPTERGAGVGAPFLLGAPHLELHVVFKEEAGLNMCHCANTPTPWGA